MFYTVRDMNPGTDTPDEMGKAFDIEQSDALIIERIFPLFFLSATLRMVVFFLGRVSRDRVWVILIKKQFVGSEFDGIDI